MRLRTAGAVVDALLEDLAHALGRPGAPRPCWRLVESGRGLVVELDDPGTLAAFDDAPALRELAESLAARGLVVDVVARGRLLATLGAVSAPWWQRRITGTRRIRVTDLRSAWRAPAPAAVPQAAPAAATVVVLPLPPEPPPLGLVS
ncbi:hypothetical protein [Nocardioides lijunqiniae]|uniref:hypothetical protein n=1 Tax=Nocardioides lijunqiniae TaxID=2760832 RepID=UPI001877884B|nr:hypothetical protein [Nocardioides lijunqiniae]